MEHGTLCARTFGQTAIFRDRPHKTAKSFFITAAYVADAISCNQLTARVGRQLTWGSCASSLSRTR
jgi:hypothetical protein